MPVVLLSCRHQTPWYRQFPNGSPVWGDWRFIFNSNQLDYDYLVAFDDLHAPIVPRCPMENTVHIATEPPVVQQYNADFTNQFGLCLTVDPDMKHPYKLYSQPGLNWFVGWDPAKGGAPGAMAFRELETLFDEPRTKLISVISSDKVFTSSHRRRLAFAEGLKEHFGDRMDFFGRGLAPMTDKLDALRGYRFHVALENTALDHYFTEKISDCLIAGCFPFYFGCPNLDTYLPERSFIPIDTSDLAGAIRAIETAISDRADETAREQLREARRRIMFEHNLFAMLPRLLSQHAARRFGNSRPAVSGRRKLLPSSDERFRHPTKRRTSLLQLWNGLHG